MDIEGKILNGIIHFNRLKQALKKQQIVQLVHWQN